MKSIRHTTAAAALAVVLLVSAEGVSAGSAAASAGDARGDKDTVVARGKSLRGDVITCEMHTSHPHYSHHAHADNRHRVNVVTTVTCSKPVTGLTAAVDLYKNGALYKRSGVERASGKKFIKQNAARRCVKNQDYRGAGRGTVVFPPGYSPRTGKVSDASPTVKIRRCRKK